MLSHERIITLCAAPASSFISEISDVLKNCNRAIILEHGTKTFDGDVKEGVELYKKIITGNDDRSKEKTKDEKADSKKQNKEM